MVAHRLARFDPSTTLRKMVMTIQYRDELWIHLQVYRKYTLSKCAVPHGDGYPPIPTTLARYNARTSALSRRHHLCYASHTRRTGRPHYREGCDDATKQDQADVARRQVRHHGLAVGSHGFTAEVMARQGFDALVVDMQHGTTELSNVLPMLQAISQTDTVPVVRVPWNDPAIIMKALDLGAYAIIVPLVNTAEDAAKAVAACRYPPVGMRSSGPVRAVHYGGADYLANANDEIVLMAMIETKEGLANLDAICATPGLDAVYIGPSDLSYALGLDPRGDNPDPVAPGDLRPDPRRGAQARHQSLHALRQRRPSPRAR